ncbi:MAG: oligosaccharide repeat unit polymerase [Bryobacteraceae bacterium]|nr:oligosaccharide repeat unit polymerase [Solibacteraceae bacterium]MCO5350423.1 oligosaccharide repeat unit polymerase [Bryobacteraceae bacterium]
MNATRNQVGFEPIVASIREGAASTELRGIAPLECFLLLCGLLLGLLAYAIPHEGVLTWVVRLMALQGLLLMGVSGIESMKDGAPGKALLASSVFLFFHYEAWLSGGVGESSFPIRVLASGYGQWPLDQIAKALIYVGVFQVCLYAGYGFRFRLKWLSRLAEQRADLARGWLWGARYWLVVFSYFPVVASFGWSSSSILEGLLSSRVMTQSSEYTDPGYIRHFATIGLFGSALLFQEAIRARSVRRFWVLLLALVGAAPTFFSGTRHLLVYLFAPMAVYGFRRKVVGERKAMFTAFLLVLLLLASVAQFAYRSRGWSSEMSASTLHEILSKPQTGQFEALLFALDLVPGRHDYFLEPMTPYFLVHPIPRALWRDKPTPQSWTYYNDTWRKGAAFNVTPSVIGQYHINYGILGVIMIGLWIGVVVALADRCAMALHPSRNQVGIATLGFFYAFVISSFRYYHPLYFFYFVFGCLCAWLFTEKGPRMKVVTVVRPAGG